MTVVIRYPTGELQVPMAGEDPDGTLVDGYVTLRPGDIDYDEWIDAIKRHLVTVAAPPPEAHPRPTGEEIFDALSAAEQDAAVGADTAAALRHGEVRLGDLVSETSPGSARGYIVGRKYDPNEPRDAHGRWTRRGGAISGSVKPEDLFDAEPDSLRDVSLNGVHATYLGPARGILRGGFDPKHGGGMGDWFGRAGYFSLTDRSGQEAQESDYAAGIRDRGVQLKARVHFKHPLLVKGPNVYGEDLERSILPKRCPKFADRAVRLERAYPEDFMYDSPEERVLMLMGQELREGLETGSLVEDYIRRGHDDTLRWKWTDRAVGIVAALEEAGYDGIVYVSPELDAAWGSQAVVFKHEQVEITNVAIDPNDSTVAPFADELRRLLERRRRLEGREMSNGKADLPPGRFGLMDVFGFVRLLERSGTGRKFDPNQPRDAHGRWSHVAGSRISPAVHRFLNTEPARRTQSDPRPPWQMTLDEFATDPRTMWHGSKWGTVGGGKVPLIHLGNWKTAHEALAANVAGQHAEGDVPETARIVEPRMIWRDRRTGETGMTFWNGRPAPGYEDRFEEIPNPDYREPYTTRPAMVPLRIVGPMSTETRHDFLGDRRAGEGPSAEGMLRGMLARGVKPRQGYYYVNEGEGVSIDPETHEIVYPRSAVVPDRSWLKTHEDFVTEALDAGKDVPDAVLDDYPHLRGRGRKYDPHQPRDRRGRWSETGAGAKLAVRVARADVEIDQDGAAVVPGHLGARYTGRVVPDDAPNRPLYHVSVHVPAVRRDGYLTVGKGGGLGAFGREESISFTTNRDLAKRIAEDMKTNVRLAKAIEEPPPLKLARQVMPPFSDEDSPYAAMNRRKPGSGTQQWVRDRDAERKRRAEWGRRLYKMLCREAERQGWQMPDFEKVEPQVSGSGVVEAPLTVMAQSYNWRDWMGTFYGHRPEQFGGNPVFIGLDQADQRKRNPDDIGIFETDLDKTRSTGALLTAVSGLEEIRVFGDVAV